eukprot:jgi/Tetstr1/459112/TSEL_004562.t1
MFRSMLPQLRIERLSRWSSSAASGMRVPAPLACQQRPSRPLGMAGKRLGNNKACFGSVPTPPGAPRPALEFPVPKRRLRRAVSADPRSGGSGTEAATAEAEVWEVDGGAHRRRRLRSGGEAGEWEELEAGGRKAAIESTGSSVLDRARSLFIPQDYPHSVTPDYLPYQLVTVAAHVTGWAELSLATSSMLKAVGVGAGVAGATAATAGIKWIVKDGVGAVGRLFVGGGLARYFDEEPRKWRMLGELVNTMGVALEIATSLYPQHFLVLAGTGTLAKSVGKGMGKPAFRVVQQHFSIRNNVGDVAAKEEVWEVTGQMLGLGVTVIILKVLETNQSIPTLLITWAVIATAHIYFRYLSLRTLRFSGLNQKRACALARSFVAGQPMPGVDEVNQWEPMLQARETVSPRVEMGSPLSAVLGAAGSVAPSMLAAYEGEAYLLAWADGEGVVALRQGAQGMDMLKALLQAAWLEHAGIAHASDAELIASLRAANDMMPGFCRSASGAGWNLEDIIIRTPDLRVVTVDRSPHGVAGADGSEG